MSLQAWSWASNNLCFLNDTPQWNIQIPAVCIFHPLTSKAPACKFFYIFPFINAYRLQYTNCVHVSFDADFQTLIILACSMFGETQKLNWFCLNSEGRYSFLQPFETVLILITLHRLLQYILEVMQISNQIERNDVVLMQIRNSIFIIARLAYSSILYSSFCPCLLWTIWLNLY